MVDEDWILGEGLLGPHPSKRKIWGATTERAGTLCPF